MNPRPLVIFLLLLFSASVFAADSARHYLVFLNPNPNLEMLEDSVYIEIQRQHLLDMTRLQESGFLLGAGPFERGGGIFIVKASSVKEVEDSIKTDAPVIAARVIPEIFPMNLYRGKLCEGDGSDMRAYEALRLNNVRFGQKELTVERMKNEIDGWIAHAEKQGKVLFVCTLGGEIPESVLIVADVPEKKRLATLRSSGQSLHYQPKGPGSFIPLLKNFFIARGTFCETE